MLKILIDVLQYDKYLKNSIGNKTKYIVLAHLSEENNKEEIAKRQLLNTIKKEESLTIYIAKQQEKLDMFEV